MLNARMTFADLVDGISEEMCQGCPPDRVCAWACLQGRGVTDNAIAARLGLPIGDLIEADVESVRQMLCECYN